LQAKEKKALQTTQTKIKADGPILTDKIMQFHTNDRPLKKNHYLYGVCLKGTG
jgi:hypothetical protein